MKYKNLKVLYTQFLPSICCCFHTFCIYICDKYIIHYYFCFRQLPLKKLKEEQLISHYLAWFHFHCSSFCDVDSSLWLVSYSFCLKNFLNSEYILNVEPKKFPGVFDVAFERKQNQRWPLEFIIELLINHNEKQIIK